MSAINVNLAKTSEIMTEATQLFTNLANTANVFVEIVKPQADVSGSDKLQAVARTVTSVQEDFTAKSNTVQRTAEGVEDYLNKLKSINAN